MRGARFCTSVREAVVAYQVDAYSPTDSRIHLHYFKVVLGISRTNADSQWNSVYNAFHRNFCCGNETIRW